jgi:hypothetical protein
LKRPPLPSTWDGFEDLWHQRQQIDKPIRSRTENQYRDLEAWKILLKRQVPVNGNENIELLFGKGMEVAVANRRPSHFRGGLHGVTGKLPRQPAVNTLVEENPHEAEATIRAFAFSRKAITCSRLTVGNPSRKSSMVSPPSR